MSDKLRRTVYVTNPDTNMPEPFLAGTRPPSWAAERIRNPSAWEQPSDEQPSEDSGASDSSELERPPESGAGSGRESWAAYAAEFGVEVTDGMGRDDIIAAVDAAVES
jgi:hypothetical protein